MKIVNENYSNEIQKRIQKIGKSPFEKMEENFKWLKMKFMDMDMLVGHLVISRKH